MRVSKYILDSAFFKALKVKKLELVSNESVNGHARYLVKCKPCGAESIRWHKSILNPNAMPCRACDKSQIKGTASSHKQWLKDNLPNLRLIGDYKGANANAKHECKDCGNIFATFPYTLTRAKGNGCPLCSRRAVQSKRNSAKRKEYVSLLKARGCTMLPMVPYKKALEPIPHKCSKCGYERTVTPDYMKRLAKCTNCCAKNKKKTVETKHKTFVLYGVEDKCLQLMRKHYKFSEIEAFNGGKVPIIPYGKGRRYMPDFFVKKDNMIVEAKGLATFGMRPFPRSKLTQAQMYYQCCEKAKATLAAGYRYAFCLIDDNGERIRLPANWYDLGYREMKKLLC